MPYLLRVLTGKQKKVIGLFAREGIEMTRIPINDYLLCNDDRCKIARFLETIENYIINLTEITDKEASRLVNENLMPILDSMEVGKIVTVVEGEYKGYSGIVRKIDNGKVHVDVCLYGRMHCVDFDKSDVALTTVPEVWR